MYPRTASLTAMRDRTSSLNALAEVLEESLSHHDMGRLLTAVKALANDLHADAIDVIANVYHFVSDGKKRKRNEEWTQMQKTEMRQLIAALRDGRSREELLDYTFL